MNREVAIELVSGEGFKLSDAEYFIGVTPDGTENDESETEPVKLMQLIRAGLYDFWRLATESISEEDFQQVIEAQREPDWKDAPDPGEIETRRSEIMFGNEEIDRVIVIEPKQDDG